MIDVISEENIEDNYVAFKKLLEVYVFDNDEQKNKFISWLDSSDAKIAPASTKYHMSCAGGLIKHSLNVFNRLVQLVKMEYGDNWEESCPYSMSTIIKVALLHDLSKVNYYKTVMKNVKVDGQWVQEPVIVTRDQDERFFYGSHELNSLYMIKTFVSTNYEEDLAIMYHMGGYDASDPKVDANKIFTAYRKSKLALLSHMADVMAMTVDENG